MGYKAIIVALTAVRQHSNADRLDLATVCGNQVVIGKGHQDGDLGIYFDTDGVLTEVFASNMNLYRKGEFNKDKTQTGMFDDNLRIRAQKFRGEKSEGFWIPLTTVQKVFKQVPKEPGIEFDTINNDLICKKYINPSTLKKQGTQKSSKKIENEMFHQHFDTAQFGRNEFMIDQNDVVIVTEKLHGTSQRVANVKIHQDLKWYHKLFGVRPPDRWEDMIGTRRVILDKKKLEEDNGFHTVSFRQRAAKAFIGNLKKGETFYYEVVGYEEGTRPIMGSHGNEKLKGHLDKQSYDEFIERYGDTTIFSYGCSTGELDVYVYRITLTNEEGYSVDLSWDAVVDRCSELGVKTVPEVFRGTRKEMAHLEAVRRPDVDGRKTEDDRDIQQLSIDYIKFLGEGKTRVGHNLSEGVCLRVEKGITPLVLKEKNFEFKCLEGIIKAQEDYVDTEEAEG